MVFRRLVTFFCLCFSPVLYSATGYHVGNSLTWMMSPDGLSAIARSNGISLDVGYHVAFGKGLDYIWEHPDEITKKTDFGGFATALRENSWDYVTLQPFGSGETLGTDIEYMIRFIDLALSGSKSVPNFYILQSWPLNDGSDYASAWLQPVANHPGERAAHSRQYFENLRIELLNHYGADFPVFIIPVGDVFYELESLFQDGHFRPYKTVFDLFIDNVHLGDLGNWIVVNTVYATVLKKDPAGIVRPVGYYGEGSAESDFSKINMKIQSIIWGLVSGHSYAGIMPVNEAF